MSGHIYPIRSLVITIHEKERKPDGMVSDEKARTIPVSHRYAIGDLKGPALHENGARGRIVSIEKRDHGGGAEFTVWVENDGGLRPWALLSSGEYQIQLNLKEHI